MNKRITPDALAEFERIHGVPYKPKMTRWHKKEMDKILINRQKRNKKKNQKKYVNTCGKGGSQK